VDEIILCFLRENLLLSYNSHCLGPKSALGLLLRMPWWLFSRAWCLAAFSTLSGLDPRLNHCSQPARTMRR